MAQLEPRIYSVLPLRDIVIFPGMVAPLFVGREKSIGALEDVIRQDRRILLVTQKDASVDNPQANDLYQVGVVASILQLLKLPDSTVKVLVEGEERVKITKFVQTDGFFKAEVESLQEESTSSNEIIALCRSVISQLEKYTKLNKKITPEVMGAIAKIEEPGKLADTVAAQINLKINEKQQVLEEPSVEKRLEKIFAFIEEEMEVMDAEQKIRARVKKQMEKTQKEYYLNEQLKAIQKELGDASEGKDEGAELEAKIKSVKLSKEAAEKAKQELKKLRTMAPMSAEATVIRNYLDWLLGIPWKKYTRVKHDLNLAQDILNDDHYGLDKVKERILEYLAVQKRTKKLKGPILCLVGPPGVGKTSLARSIARSTGRNFVKMSLGGMRDEAEIRGHRKTYIGSMPGKIIQSIRKAASANPLFLLDEIDKMGVDFRGDPASALLEVLDPEQNNTFNDHYLEVDYDLSQVLFVATANTLNLPHALLDRLEIIRLSGYTEEEKIEIARRHLIPKQREFHGLKEEEWDIAESALRDLLHYYTREAGVRSLEREIANLARKVTKEILMKKNKTQVIITSKNLKKYAGVRRYTFGVKEKDDMVGIVNGLAYTEFGGDLLTIEAVSLPGKGEIRSTGKLGDVMQESAQAAFSYIRSRCLDYGIIPPYYRKKDLHIHVPEGATPKDGPSAGVAMCTAIVSVLTGIAVKQSVAMTGEITLRGRVLGIGGLEEKLLSALRGGIKTVIIPKENEKDLEEMPANVMKKLEIIPVATVAEVLAIALVKKPEPIEWSEEKEENVPPSSRKDGEEQGEIVHH